MLGIRIDGLGEFDGRPCRVVDGDHQDAHVMFRVEFRSGAAPDFGRTSSPSGDADFKIKVL
jgi:hypothetical protein